MCLRNFESIVYIPRFKLSSLGRHEEYIKNLSTRFSLTNLTGRAKCLGNPGLPAAWRRRS